MKIIAHRGYSKLYGDNNLTSFKMAIESKKFDMIEMDIQTDPYGTILVNHDLIFDFSEKYLTLQEFVDTIEVPKHMIIYLDLKGPVHIVQALETFFLKNRQLDITQFIVCSFNINYLRMFKLPFELGFITSNSFSGNDMKNILHDNITNVIIEWTSLNHSVISWCHNHGINVFTFTPRNNNELTYALRFDLDGVVVNSPISSSRLE